MFSMSGPFGADELKDMQVAMEAEELCRKGHEMFGERKFQDGVKFYSEAVQLERQLVAKGGSRKKDLSSALRNLGMNYFYQGTRGTFKSAADAFEECLALMREEHAAAGCSQCLHLNEVLEALGACYARIGEVEKSIAVNEEALTRLVESYDAMPASEGPKERGDLEFRIGQAYLTLGMTYAHAPGDGDHLPRAEELLTKSVVYMEKCAANRAPGERWDVAVSLACLASVVMEQGRLDQAMASCKRAEEVLKRENRTAGPGWEDVAAVKKMIEEEMAASDATMPS